MFSPTPIVISLRLLRGTSAVSLHTPPARENPGKTSPMLSDVLFPQGTYNRFAPYCDPVSGWDPTHLNSDSGAPLSPLPAVKVENYCNDTLQYLVKAESPFIAAIPLLQHPEVDVKVVGMQTSAKPSLRVKAESPASPARVRGVPSAILFPASARKCPTSCASKQSPPPPFSLYERGLPKRKYSEY